METAVNNLKSEIIPIETLNVQEKSYDLLITAISPEDRSYMSVNRVLTTFSIRKCILTTFTDLLKDAKEEENYLKNWFEEEQSDLDGIAQKSWENNRRRIKELLKEKSVETIEIQGDSMDIRVMIKEMQQNIHGEKEILFDISSFPKCYILEILRWIESNIVTIVYTRGEHESDPERYSIGVKKVTTLPGFEGKFRARADLLALLLGFEGFRSLALLNWYEPYRALACIGDTEDVDRERYIETAKKNNKLLLDHHMVYEELIPSLSHPINISKKLEIATSKFLNTLGDTTKEGYNIYASPLGTKLQAVGLFLYWQKHKDIQIVYAFPTKRRVGTGSIGRTYVFEVNKQEG